VLYSRVTKRFGYVRTAAAASVLVAVAVAMIGLSPWVALVVLAIGLSGLFSGVVIPATASMIGLETPPAAQSTAFGLNASSVAFGFFIGPLIAGGVAATANVSVALLVIAVMALALAALLRWKAREPVR
jgi:MFS family permease